MAAYSLAGTSGGILFSIIYQTMTKKYHLISKYPHCLSGQLLLGYCSHIDWVCATAVDTNAKT
jgi:hypothetical protein